MNAWSFFRFLLLIVGGAAFIIIITCFALFCFVFFNGKSKNAGRRACVKYNLVLSFSWCPLTQTRAKVWPSIIINSHITFVRSTLRSKFAVSY